MNLVATLLSLFTLSLLGVLIFQMRRQRVATEELLADNRIRTRLYQDADESTTFILSRTIQNVAAGHPIPNLESDSFLSTCANWKTQDFQGQVARNPDAWCTNCSCCAICA